MKKSELRAEINDRESERGDLRDRVEKAEAALTRVREVRRKMRRESSAWTGTPYGHHAAEFASALDAALDPASPAEPPTVEQADRAAVVVAMTKAATGLGWFPWTAESSADEVTVTVQSEPPPTHSERLATLRKEGAGQGPAEGPRDLYECPQCSAPPAPWTDGTVKADGDERDEFWCQTCGWESPLEDCVKRTETTCATCSCPTRSHNAAGSCDGPCGGTCGLDASQEVDPLTPAAGRCYACGRFTWAAESVGLACLMTQPDGSLCPGAFEPTEAGA